MVTMTLWDPFLHTSKESPGWQDPQVMAIIKCLLTPPPPHSWLMHRPQGMRSHFTVHTVVAKALTVLVAALKEAAVAVTVEMVTTEVVVEAAVGRVVAARERIVMHAAWKGQLLQCSLHHPRLGYPCPGRLDSLWYRDHLIKSLIICQRVGTVLEWPWVILVNSL